MGKSSYVAPEKLTKKQILAAIDECFHRWNDIAWNGCQDPFWSDGLNMNLVRNHIIWYYGLLDKKEEEDVQEYLFGDTKIVRRPIPAKVPDNYMVANCKYSDRLDSSYAVGSLEFGEPGEFAVA